MHIMDGILHLPESVSETALKLGVPEFPRLLKEQNHVSKVDNIGDSTFFVPKELIDRMPTNTIELSDIIAFVVLWVSKRVVINLNEGTMSLKALSFGLKTSREEIWRFLRSLGPN